MLTEREETMQDILDLDRYPLTRRVRPSGRRW